MILPILFFATVGVAVCNPLYAAIVWTVGVSFMHMLEEGDGRLWAYFGEIAAFPRLKQASSIVGFSLIVAPAFLLQTLAAFKAFGGDGVSVFWLALLIGARLGDGLFSHAIPFAQGYKLEKNEYQYSQQLNPGLSTGVVYLVDGLVLTLLFLGQLTAEPAQQLALTGFAVGAGFFAAVLPTLKILGQIHD